MRIAELPAGELDRLEPLWVGVHRHHQTVAPGLAPYVDDATTWAVRAPVYAQLLAAGGFALVATRGGRDVGYALAGHRPAPWSATFATAPAIAELESLAVAEGERGTGVGSCLLDAVDARLDRAGAHDRLIGVVHGNDRAVALYRRRGYVPTWLTLSRFASAAPPSGSADEGTDPSGAPPPAAIAAVAPDEVEALRGLWLELHHHHQAVAPGLGPFVPDDASWEVVRALLARAAAEEILLRAGPAPAPLAFAWAGVERDDPLWADTWVVGRDVAEVHMLVVADGARGRGLGSALLDELDRELASRGVHDQVIGAIAPNADAIRLYARRGFRPTWLELTRHAARARG